MKKKQLLAYGLTVLSLVFLVQYSYDYIYMQYRESDVGATKDTRSQIMDTRKYNPSVLVGEKKNPENYGTGYVVSKNTVVTNKHVVMAHQNAPGKIMVRVGHKDVDGKVKFKEFEVEKVTVPKDETLDVGVLTLKPNKEGKSIGDVVDPVKFGNGSKVKKGSTLNVIGYPGDKEYGTLWLSSGTVKQRDGNFIMYDAITMPGNSGSPIFNDKGEVVAMVNAGEKNVSYGFVVDDALKKYIEGLMK